jgi:Protein of unknown function (DUF1264)
MDRRELFGALGALGAAPVCTAATEGAKTTPAAHAADKDGGPMGKSHLHFCGIHMAKKNPKLQFVTQHYCAAHTGGSEGDVFQCVLFDGTGANAKLVGVEYLISDEAYRKLPDAEKKYWHAHTYEVLGGGLIAPGMAKKDEDAFMKVILTTWGKAWHTWPDPATAIPTGEPMLIWSLIGDGQADPKVVARRDAEFKCDSAKVAGERAITFGLKAPNVALPKGESAIGRQWTDTGDDTPTKLK